MVDLAGRLIGGREPAMQVDRVLPEPVAANECPSSAILSRYRAGDLSELELGSVSAHIAQCARCKQSLANLPSAPDERLLASKPSPQSRLDSEVDLLDPPGGKLVTADPSVMESGDAHRVIGQYQLMSYLGHGGMGKVYRALHVKLKRQVALKCLPNSSRRDPDRKARFLREMEAIGQIEHENIVRATDAGEHEGTLFLVMDLVRGIDLHEFLMAHGPLQVADACAIAREVASGLNYLEQRQIVHRDVKPANIMLSFEGKVKLLDLGLARFNVESGGGMTSTGQAVGTADYIAPEQVRGEPGVSTPADVYSLGCTLFHMLTGLPVFHGKKYDSAFLKMRGHSDDPPPTATSLRHGLPDELSRFVGQLLAKAPTERPRPRTIIERLGKWCEGSDLAALARQGAAEAQTRCNSSRVDGNAPTAPHSPRPAPGRLRRSVGRVVANRRTAIGLLGASCAGAGLAWFNGWPPFHRTHHLPDLHAIGWQPLLSEPPTKLVWPATSRLFDYNEPRRELSFSCEGIGLLGWGTADCDNYRARFHLSQSRWTSGLGVFFGYHALAVDKSPRAVYQLLQLTSFQSSDLAHSFRLDRGEETIVFGGGPSPSVSSHAFASNLIPTPSGGEHLLEFAVGTGSLLEVRWDGVRLPSLTDAAANGMVAPGTAKGLLGIYASYTTAVVSMADYMVTSL